jgi:hypothetical protein
MIRHAALGLDRSTRPSKPADRATNAMLHEYLTTSDRSSAGFLRSGDELSSSASKTIP